MKSGEEPTSASVRAAGHDMKRVAIAALLAFAMVVVVGLAIWPTGEGIHAGLTGRGVLEVTLEKGHAEKLCSANGATVRDWPDPPASGTVAVLLPPGGYFAVIGAYPCQGGCAATWCEVRWGQVTKYPFVPISNSLGP
jgi:hypothetical protein